MSKEWTPASICEYISQNFPYWKGDEVILYVDYLTFNFWIKAFNNMTFIKDDNYKTKDLIIMGVRVKYYDY